MEGICILAENVIKVEDVKEEKVVIKEEYNWNCVEEAESSAIPCSVKNEHDSDEELERPVCVFLRQDEGHETLCSVEEKDPLGLCCEESSKREDASWSSGESGKCFVYFAKPKNRRAPRKPRAGHYISRPVNPIFSQNF
ncbi:hypothetical protein R5R35_001057 [Gryllus longicercus]|uniref:Uncharacterized protein n=1 Tax=Gryllus longicercus TaxID=2509291 RepID=A0AAN9VWI0_9ORTH